jgi:hypothetical protein
MQCRILWHGGKNGNYFKFSFFQIPRLPLSETPIRDGRPSARIKKKGSGSLYLYTYSDQVKQIIVIRPRFLLPVEEEDYEQREIEDRAF